MRKTLIVVLTCLCLAVIVYSLMQVFSRDVAPSDYAEFAFDRAIVAAESNAYTYVIAAVELINLSDDERLAILDYRQGKPVDETLIADLLARNQVVFDQVRKAVTFDVYEPPVFSWNEEFPPISSLILLTQMLTTKAQANRLSGNQPEAVADCVTMLRLGGFVKGSPNSVIEYLVGLAMTGMGISETRSLVRDATLSAVELARLIETLQAIDTLNADLERSLKAEALLVANLFETAMNEGPDLSDLFSNLPEWVPTVPMGWASGYFLHRNRTEQKLVAMYRSMLRNARWLYADRDRFDLGADGASDHGIRAVMAALKPNAFGKRMVEMLMPMMDGILTRKCRTEASLRGTLLIAALRAYEQRTGSLPDDLSALVPDTLAAVPTDPFDCEPFRYCPERRIVYAVGINLTDFGGTRGVYEGFEADPTYQESGRLDDIVFELAPPPSIATGGDGRGGGRLRVDRADGTAAD